MCIHLKLQFQKMSLKSLGKCLLLLTILFTFILSAPIQIKSFKQLAEHHCSSFPLEILYRLSSGTLAQKYGSKYSEIDCYVRQFVNQDGQNKQQIQEEDEQQQQENEQQTEQTTQQQENEYQFPQIDPIVIQYAKGINCLPQGVDSVHATYKIWRFYRYLIHHDYAYEWLRAKIRSSLGYEGQKPNAWMDGQQSAKRLRLDKLFSNQFYDYVDKLMFKDFLFPLMTFLKKNVVVGLEGSLTNSGKPMLLQYIQSRNVVQQFFQPIVFTHQSTSKQIFTYTMPGIPLFLGGSSGDFLWAFTGILVDRSNVQQIQTVGTKFYHHGIQEWIQLNNVSLPISVKDQEPYTCTYMHSSYGTLYEKHNGSGKISQYIVRWHESQPKVRNLFTELYNLILNTGNTERNLEFPFNSLVIANQTGIFNHLCQQYHPSYFIYPDLAGAPDDLPTLWVTNPKKGAFVIANTHLTTQHQESYINKDILSPLQEQLIIQIRRATVNKKTLSSSQLWKTILGVHTDTTIKKRKDHLIFMYRKSKFVFFPEQQTRKQCDQLLSIAEKWDNNIDSDLHSPVFILWDYFFREYTFNHVSSSKLGRHIAKHRALTDVYWTGQPQLWKKVISYGECDSQEWKSEGWDVILNNTGLNCTCFFNVNRGLNRTRQILRNIDGSIDQNMKLSKFIDKKIIDLTQNYVGSHIQEAFNNYYSRNLAFVAQLNNNEIVYLRTYKQIQEKVTLANKIQVPDQTKVEQQTDTFNEEL